MTRWRFHVLGAASLLLLGVTLAWWRFSPSDNAGQNVSFQSPIIREAQPQEILDHVHKLGSPVVLINFWASWCQPCKEEFPNILALKKQFEAKGLKVVFVSVDDIGDASTAEAFLKEQKVDFLTYYKGDQPLSFVNQIFPEWTGAVPASVLMGPDLKILDAWEGDTTQAEFETRIQKFLKGT